MEIYNVNQKNEPFFDMISLRFSIIDVVLNSAYDTSKHDH